MSTVPADRCLCGHLKSEHAGTQHDHYCRDIHCICIAFDNGKGEK